ncbi:hypothetical protein FS749_006574, partial [Ceratobasidium sp. UAMH 11750]
MRRLLQVHPNQKMSIRALAFDPLRHILAVGCGAEVYIYSQSIVSGSEEWNCVERIPGPVWEGNQGIVTALCFFDQSPDNCCLFVRHTMAGVCIWKSPGIYERTPKAVNVSSIGSATIASDERFITISSLDQSIVTYALGPSGPVLHEQQEFPFHEQTDYSPIVPIALTSNNLIFKGTASGDIPILDSTNGPMAPIHLGAKRIVRTLTTHGDKVVVGSSDAGGFQQGSHIECYSTGLAGTRHEWARPGYAFPQFALSLGDILALEKDTVADKLRVYVGLVWIWVLAIVLTVDPPFTPAPVDTTRWSSKPKSRNFGSTGTEVSFGYQQPE